MIMTRTRTRNRNHQPRSLTSHCLGHQSAMLPILLQALRMSIDQMLGVIEVGVVDVVEDSPVARKVCCNSI